jgi:mRNA deadenylase 3'-5' endonuclease subunit Ccr4
LQCHTRPADWQCNLQEVDRKVFERYLQPHLALAGFAGVYTNKAGQVAEGSATFFRTERFELAAKCDPGFPTVSKQHCLTCH